MRGKEMPERSVEPIDRITPAYAGKSEIFNNNMEIPRDHPRLCGEKTTTGIFNRTFAGSPPPMRGKVTDSSEFCAYIRITPAYAGKSCVCACFSACKRDHPRLCGEKNSNPNQGQHEKGSPPPMRGKGHLLYLLSCVGRITPAYAGKRLEPPHR